MSFIIFVLSLRMNFKNTANWNLDCNISFAENFVFGYYLDEARFKLTIFQSDWAYAENMVIW